MQNAGVHVARWFLFFYGRAGITYDQNNGTPTGLDDALFNDLDAAIGIAQTYDIKIVFVLISFEWMGEKLLNDITGGRSRETTQVQGGISFFDQRLKQRNVFAKQPLCP